MEITLNDIKTVCVKATGGPETYKVAFDELESKLESLKGRKFYGVMQDKVYRACVAIIEANEPETLGFEVYIIPSGRYVQEKISDWVHNLGKIGSTFQSMEKDYKRDKTRPIIAFYKSQKELILLLPIQ